MIQPTFSLPLLSTVEKGIETIVGTVSNGIYHLLPQPVQQAVNTVSSTIENTITTVENGISQITNGVTAGIGNALGNVIPGAIEVLHSLVGGLLIAVTNLARDIATTEDVIGSAINTLKPYAGQFGGWLGQTLSNAIGGGFLGTLSLLEVQHPEVIDHFLDESLANPALPDFLKTAMTGLRQRGAEWQALALPVLLVFMLRGMAEAAADPAMTWARQTSNRKFPVKALDPPTAVEARIKGIIDLPRFYDEMAQHGYDQDRTRETLAANRQRLLPEEVPRIRFRDLMPQDAYLREMAERGFDEDRAALHLEGSRPLIPEQDIRDLFLRGYVDLPTHDKLMAQHGYLQEQIDRRRRLYYLIPGPNDLIHMAIRNVFSPEIVERFKLFGDFPESFKQAALMQGISEDWALKYWGAHWIVPSNQEGFDMFHRTTIRSEDENADTFTLSDGTRVQNVIGRSTLQLLLREKDTAPYYRAKLTEIAYNPLTRIDVRRMHKVGSLTHAGVERAYLDLGYSPTNALRLADYVEKLNHAELRDRAAPIIDRLKNRIIDLYIAEKLDLSDASFALKDLGFTDAEQDYFLAEAKVIQQSEEATAIEAGIGKLYTAQFIDKAEAEARLAKLAVPSAAVASLFRKWDLAIEYRDLSETHKKARELTKAEILDGYKARLMKADDARTFLRSIRYTDVEIDLELGLADFQVQKQARTTQIDAIKALYVNGVRDQLTTSNSLDALTMPATQRDAYLAEWQLQKEQRTEKIPLATLRDMIKAKFLTRAEAEDELRSHRLTDTKIAILLDFWQGVKH